jgi:acid phosphatase
VRELTNAGKTWKVYAEDLPSVGYLGGDTGNYLKHHNPFVYFSDVQNNPSQQSNVVPFTQFATDLANNALPNYAFVVPNMIDDGHSCPPSLPQCGDSVEVQNADNWLKTNIAPVLGNSSFSNGLLAITWDSGDVGFSHGGGQVPLILAGAGVKTGFVSTIFYQHPSLLRLSMEHLQLSPNLGAAATAPDVSDMVPSP